MTKQRVDIHVGNRLRSRRVAMGLSQQEVAKAAGITFQQVQKYEKGTNALSAHRLYEFARFMHLPVSSFFDGLGGSESKDSLNSQPKSGHTVSILDQEAAELMKSFSSIKNRTVRKRFADLMRALAD